MTYIASDFTPDDPEQYMFIVEKICEHRAWFDDFTWEDPVKRRVAANLHLADAYSNGKIWEVYDVEPPGVTLAGIIVLNQVTLSIDAFCHFIFFDHKLAGKQAVCLDAARWAFSGPLQLEVLRVSIPTYAAMFCDWSRKRLGFRYEAEALLAGWLKKHPQSNPWLEKASSQRKATKHKGKWHNAVQLSLTKQEFISNHGPLKAIDQHPSIGPER